MKDEDEEKIDEIKKEVWTKYCKNHGNKVYRLRKKAREIPRLSNEWNQIQTKIGVLNSRKIGHRIGLDLEFQMAKTVLNAINARRR